MPSISENIVQHLRDTTGLNIVDTAYNSSSADEAILVKESGGPARKYPDNRHDPGIQFIVRAKDQPTAKDNAFIVFDKMREAEYGFTLSAPDFTGGEELLAAHIDMNQRPFYLGVEGGLHLYSFNAIITFFEQINIESPDLFKSWKNVSSPSFPAANYDKGSSFHDPANFKTYTVGGGMASEVTDSDPGTVSLKSIFNHPANAVWLGDDNHFYSFGSITDTTGIYKSNSPNDVSAFTRVGNLAYGVYGALLLVNESYIILIGGWIGVFGTKLQWALRSDPTVWTDVGPVIPTGFANACGAIIEGKAVIYGGQTSGAANIINICDDAIGDEIINPANWRKSLNSLPAYRGFPSIAVEGDDIAIIAGHDDAANATNSIFESNASNFEAVVDSGATLPFSARYGHAFRTGSDDDVGKIFYLEKESGGTLNYAVTAKTKITRPHKRNDTWG